MAVKVSETVIDDPLLTASECSEIIGISEPTWWRWVREGTAPKPVKLGRGSRWPRSDPLGMIERAKAARAAA